MKSYYILLLFFTSLIISACYQQTEGCLDPYASNYDLSVDMDCEDCCIYPSFSILTLHRYDSSRLDQDSLYRNLLNQQYLLQSMDFYIRDIQLITSSNKKINTTDRIRIPLKSGDTAEVVNNLYLINPETSNVFQVPMKDTNLGIKSAEEDITAIEFNIGLGTLAETIDLSKVDSTHFLATSATYMYDTLNTKYHSAKISYALDKSSTGTIYKIFIDENINITLPIDFPFINELGKNIEPKIKLDYKLLFDNIDFENDNSKTIQQKWAKNIKNAFKIIE